MYSPNTHIVRQQIAALLSEISDPEIPGISIVDLGMVIAIHQDNGSWKIVLAPTYSGCPAIDVIPFLVRTRLEEAGFHNLDITMQISPPWSTDWISEEGKNKLHDYGIAPPHGKAAFMTDEGHPQNCPQCGSAQTELISRYGSTPCKAAYKCLVCKEPFEYFKCF